MEINVTVDGIDGIDMKTAATEARTYDRDAEEYTTRDVTIGELVARQITAKLTKDEEYPGLRKKFLEIRDEEIRAAVKPIVESTLTEAIQPTNSYGQPIGTPTTLTELILKEARDYLTRKVDSSYRGGSQTIVEKIVAEAVSKQIRTELGEALAEEKAKVVAAVRAKAADVIAEAVKQGIGR